MHKTGERGVNVVIVGNAPVIQPIGDLVDKHDLVVRFNHFQLDGYEHLIGSRTTDWWMHDPGVYMDTPFDRSELHTMVSGDDLGRMKSLLPAVCAVRLNFKQIRYQIQREGAFRCDVVTTGIKAIHYYMRMFDVVDIVGFGPEQESLKGHLSPTHPSKTVERAHSKEHWREPAGPRHNWNAERKLINKWVSQGRITRLENGIR
jgi:hypothetical protein